MTSLDSSLIHMKNMTNEQLPSLQRAQDKSADRYQTHPEIQGSSPKNQVHSFIHSFTHHTFMEHYLVEEIPFHKEFTDLQGN